MKPADDQGSVFMGPPFPRFVLADVLAGLERERPTPFGFLYRSQHYLNTAERLVPKWRSPRQIDRDMWAETYPACEELVGRSVELALKAYLLARGEPVDKLRKEFGHDLDKALNHAVELGIDKVISLSGEQAGVIRVLSMPYRTRELAYQGLGSPVKIPIERGALFGAADALVWSSELDRVCREAALRGQNVCARRSAGCSRTSPRCSAISYRASSS